MDSILLSLLFHLNFFKKIVNKASINLPDGQGVIWAAKILGHPIGKRITGADLMEKLVKLAQKEQITIGLIGGFGNLAVSAFECLKKRWPGLKGWAQAGPAIKVNSETVKVKSRQWLDYQGWDIKRFIQQVKKRKTAILFVGFGYPKQELFINEIAPKLENIVLLAVGGTFSYLNGSLKRAPYFLRQAGFEWFYRLWQEPKRLGRQLALWQFVFFVFLEFCQKKWRMFPK